MDPKISELLELGKHQDLSRELAQRVVVMFDGVPPNVMFPALALAITAILQTTVPTPQTRKTIIQGFFQSLVATAGEIPKPKSH